MALPLVTGLGGLKEAHGMCEQRSATRPKISKALPGVPAHFQAVHAPSTFPSKLPA